MLKAAVHSGQPPLAVIFNDPEHKEWDEWDFKLFKAHYVLQDWYRDGIPIWWDESDRVAFDVKARTSKSRAAIERAQESSSKNNKSSPGKYFIAVPIAIGGGELPTRDEWLEEQEQKNGKSQPINKFSSGDSPKNKVVQGRK